MSYDSFLACWIDFYHNTACKVRIFLHLVGGRWQCSESGLPSGVVASAANNTLLGYAANVLSIPVVAAHVTCCSGRPHPKQLANLWKENLPPLMNFLDHAGQGVFGVVSSVDGKKLAGAALKVQSAQTPTIRLTVTDQVR